MWFYFKTLKDKEIFFNNGQSRYFSFETFQVKINAGYRQWIHKHLTVIKESDYMDKSPLKKSK